MNINPNFSTFNALINLITVRDICEPFIDSYSTDQKVEEIWESWSESCLFKQVDPMEQIAVIKKDSKVVGWVGFDMLHDTDIIDCIDTINGDSLLSSNTPILKALQTMTFQKESIFLVLNESKFVGFLHLDHFNKLPFRICLFSLLIDIERLMLEILKSSPTKYLSNLTENRLNRAKEVYKNRKFKYDDNGLEYDAQLVECTYIVDKFTMLKKSKDIIAVCPNLLNDFISKVDNIRNATAHPSANDEKLPLKNMKDLLPFILWAEELHKQLSEYIFSI
jgi:hypothetical protein